MKTTLHNKHMSLNSRRQLCRAVVGIAVVLFLLFVFGCGGEANKSESVVDDIISGEELQA